MPGVAARRGVCVRYGSPRAWALLTLGVAALGALEVAVGVLVVDRLVPDPWAGWIHVGVVLTTAALVLVVASPLTGRVCLEADAVVVTFGLLGRVRVPTGAIGSAAAAMPSPGQAVPLGLEVTGDRLTVSRAGAHDSLTLLLTRPVIARYQVVRSAPVTRIDVVVDDPEGLLASIGPHLRPTR